MKFLGILILISSASAFEPTAPTSGCSCPCNDAETKEKLIELTKTVNSIEQKLDKLMEEIVPKKVVGQDCTDLYKRGFKKDGVHTVNPDGMGEFQVYCDQTTKGGGWTIFQRRLDGSVDFFRGWNEYVSGFGDVHGEYWLGLERINRLTRRGTFRLRVDLEDTTGDTRYAEYEKFSVLGKQTKYKLSIGKYSGTAGNSLGYHNDRPFTTKDQDTDSYGSNCAVKFKAGWWYGACHNANLNGMYYYGSYKSYADGVVWEHWRGDQYSLKGSEMKTRPMDY